jgi:hypothetical protein
MRFGVRKKDELESWRNVERNCEWVWMEEEKQVRRVQSSGWSPRGDRCARQDK